MDDSITPNKPDMTNCATDYGRRCQSIGMERRSPRDLDSAMRHPRFKARHHQLLDELAKEYESGRPIMERTPWMTIQLGTYKSNYDLRKDLVKRGHIIGVGDLASDILNKIDVASEPIEVDLMVLSNAELGYPNGCTIAKSFKAGKKLGLELCPAEVGPQLRLQYTDQLMGEWVLVAMDPITDSYGGLSVFSVARDGDGSWLVGRNGHPGRHWDGDFRWVFVRRK